jgi:hypothetical protein
VSALDFEQLYQAINGKFGVHDIACPLCGPDRRAPANRVRKVFRVWYVSPGFASYVCARCGERGYVRPPDAPKINARTYACVSAEQATHASEAAAVRLDKALALWRARQPIQGSIAEKYLRQTRAYGGPLPPTLGFLPARGAFSPAIIAAFGIPDESEPNVLALPDANVRGVHLTRLASDGCDRDRSEKAKIMIGHSKGWPIVLSPPTDGLSVVLAEGIENALSGYEATGLHAWVAGSASRLPALADAMPSWVESVTILADDDDTGRENAIALAKSLKKRGVIEVRLPGFIRKVSAA